MKNCSSFHLWSSDATNTWTKTQQISTYRRWLSWDAPLCVSSQSFSFILVQIHPHWLIFVLFNKSIILAGRKWNHLCHHATTAANWRRLFVTYERFSIFLSTRWRFLSLYSKFEWTHVNKTKYSHRILNQTTFSFVCLNLPNHKLIIQAEQTKNVVYKRVTFIVTNTTGTYKSSNL